MEMGEQSFAGYSVGGHEVALPLMYSKSLYLAEVRLVGRDLSGCLCDGRRVDMIFGANDMQKWQILENCEWKDSEPFKPLIGLHPIGSIGWGLKLDKRDNHYVCAIHSTPKRNYAEQILDIVSTEHNISAEECHQ